jgi:hypothetical protein
MTLAGILAVATLTGCRASPSTNADEANMTAAAENGVYVTTTNGPVTAVAVPAPAPCRENPEDDSIAGIRLGMKADDAFRQIQCVNPAITPRFTNYPGLLRAHYPGEPEARDVILAGNMDQDGNAGDGFDVELAGELGDENVSAVYRVMRFRPGEEPTVENMKSTLEKKYRFKFYTQPGSYVSVASIGARGPATVECLPQLTAGASGTVPNPKCETLKSARIEALPTNMALVQRVVVAVTNGSFHQTMMQVRNRIAADKANSANLAAAEEAKKRAVPKM